MADWIDINLPWWTMKGDSFCERELHNPGTLVQTEDGIFLIGDINQLAGVCDDCKAFGNDTIILRYKVIWNKEDES